MSAAPKIPSDSPLPWEAAKPVNAADARATHELQVIKGRVHRRLLERLNLSNLDRLERDQVTEAIRKVVHDLITQDALPLNFEPGTRWEYGLRIFDTRTC